jgi:hypothetical protein
MLHPTKQVAIGAGPTYEKHFDAATVTGVGAENESFRSNSVDIAGRLPVSKAFKEATLSEHSVSEAADGAASAADGHSAAPCAALSPAPAEAVARHPAHAADTPWHAAAGDGPDRTPEAALVAGVQTPDIPDATPSGVSQASPRRLDMQLSQVGSPT